MDVGRADIALRVNQRIPLVDDRAVVTDRDGGDLDDPVGHEQPCGLCVHDDEPVPVAE